MECWKINVAIFPSRQIVFPSELLKLPLQSPQIANRRSYAWALGKSLGLRPRDFPRAQAIFQRIPLLLSQYSSNLESTSYFLPDARYKHLYEKTVKITELKLTVFIFGATYHNGIYAKPGNFFCIATRLNITQFTINELEKITNHI